MRDTTSCDEFSRMKLAFDLDLENAKEISHSFARLELEDVHKAIFGVL